MAEHTHTHNNVEETKADDDRIVLAAPISSSASLHNNRDFLLFFPWSPSFLDS
ncbi:unnamed protein product [Periconia digitata]|uniref:Uncharacterized protein n=1 Tax=Periconia digitata TaxID=1303443 RepID=A0A9W4XGS1_9PLEO|nr:unnamed protein product [Periconia digitata]